MSVGEAIEVERSGQVGSIAFVADLLTVCADRFGLDTALEWGCLDGRGLRTAAQDLSRAVAALQHQQRLVGGLDERSPHDQVGGRDLPRLFRRDEAQVPVCIASAKGATKRLPLDGNAPGSIGSVRKSGTSRQSADHPNFRS